MRILPNINGHDDLLRLTDSDRTELCREIREFLVSHVSRTGGHLASNLGMVELTVAIETVFNTMQDRLVFDVGHQSYVHKLLTGRQAGFEHLRQFGGMSGFPKPGESDADAFVAGHASSSVSIALGMARARTLQQQDYKVVALIGDGAATGGMAYEALNDVAVSKEPMVIILNDNEMSIDRNVGGLARHLSNLRCSDEYLRLKTAYRKVLERIPGGTWFYRFSSRVKNRLKRMLLNQTIFENMGLTYLGPVDGHDLPDLISLLTSVKNMNEPVLVHVLTRKGYGYAPAEQNPRKFHGISKFDPESGNSIGSNIPTFSESFGASMVELGRENERLCAITAAMPTGTGLVPFRKAFPNRCFDVGIAEEHAVSMAGGLAKQGMIPVVALYSTFLQRAFDQMMQDTAILNLHVVYAIDRAGLVGDDGETHHGIYDVGLFRQVPGMTVLCPASLAEQAQMLRWAVSTCDGPVAVRYPRGGNGLYEGCDWVDPSRTPVRCHRSGADVTIVTYGTMLDQAMEAAQILAAQGIEGTVLRLQRILPLPVEAVVSQISEQHNVVILEEAGGGSDLGADLACHIRSRLPDSRIRCVNLGKRFITHGSRTQLLKHYGLDGHSVAYLIREMMASEN